MSEYIQTSSGFKTATHSVSVTGWYQLLDDGHVGIVKRTDEDRYRVVHNGDTISTATSFAHAEAILSSYLLKKLRWRRQRRIITLVCQVIAAGLLALALLSQWHCTATTSRPATRPMWSDTSSERLQP